MQTNTQANDLELPDLRDLMVCDQALNFSIPSTFQEYWGKPLLKTSTPLKVLQVGARR